MDVEKESNEYFNINNDNYCNRSLICFIIIIIIIIIIINLFIYFISIYIYKLNFL